MTARWCTLSYQLADPVNTAIFSQEQRRVHLVEDRQPDHERALAERARSDRNAFAELYRSQVDAVFGFAFRMSGSADVAEEATSATFERALRSIRTFEWRGGGVRPWLFRIASNEVCEVYRRRARANGRRGQRALQILTSDVADAVAGFEVDSDAAELAALRAAMKKLTPRYQEAISLRYLGEMSADEAATAMGCSKPVFAVTLHRALGALKKEMGGNTTNQTGGSTEGRGVQ